MRWRLMLVLTVLIWLGVFGTIAGISWLTQPVPRCEIIGDHEVVTGHCIPYCPPKPSECG